MFESASQDAQWLEALPQNLDYDFQNSFWDQPDAAKAWYADEEIEFVEAPEEVEFVEPAASQAKAARKNSKKPLLRLVSTVICIIFVQSL